MDTDKTTGGARPEGTRTADAAWSVVSYLVAGMMVWGGIGWAVDWYLDMAAHVFFAVGVVIGVALGSYLTLVRHGRL